MEEAWTFGPYALFAARRRLERDGAEVKLGVRSFDLLVALVRRAGAVIGKAELMAQVWGDIVVDETSLRVHLSLLRKALAAPAPDGAEWIVNVPLRGYGFRAAVVALAPVATGGQERCGSALALRAQRLYGRADEIERIDALLRRTTLLTVAGPGGIGKTVTAIALARRWRAGGAVVALDLAPLADAGELLAAFAAALQTTPGFAAIGAALTGRAARGPLLLLLDNCEHVLDVLAPLVRAWCDGVPGLFILATSRAPLQLAGETVYRLGPLPAPLPLARQTLAEALAYPAAELLAARAVAAGAGPFDDSHAALLATVCQQLDGIPLALELAAARLSVMTLPDLAGRLDQHMQLRTVGGRAVLARHQTMAAALDWSLALLDEEETRLLRCLSVFRSRFDLECVLRVAGTETEAAFAALSGLVAKSLLCFDPQATDAPYRLLSVTRAYACRLLAASPEREVALRRHATWVRDLARASVGDAGRLAPTRWEARYGHLPADVGAALDWALARDPALAAELAQAARVLAPRALTCPAAG